MLSEDLKRHTRQAHIDIESKMSPLMAADLDEMTYRRIVAAFFGFIQPWETKAASILRHADLAPLFEARRHAPQLRADLSSLGVPPADVALLPLCGEVGDLSATERDAVGAWYVLEGSTLGGQVIARHLENKLGLRDGIGYSYFRGAGPRTMPRWAEFKSTIDLVFAGTESQDIVAAANQTFIRLGHWMERCLLTIPISSATSAPDLVPRAATPAVQD